MIYAKQFHLFRASEIEMVGLHQELDKELRDFHNNFFFMLYELGLGEGSS